MSWQIRTMTPREFEHMVELLGIDRAKAARVLGISERTARRYARGEIPILPAHSLLLRAFVRLKARPIVPAWTAEQN